MQLFDPFKVSFNGLHLIEASAGTGKTYNIASLYIRAIIEKNYPVKKILVVTYTNAAAKELRERLMKRIGEAIQALKGGTVKDDTFLSGLQDQTPQKEKAILKLKAAARNFDEAAIYTIHGFCRHVLQEYAFESGSPFSAEFIGDDSEILQEVVDDYWRGWIGENSEAKHRQPLINFILKKGYTPEKLTRQFSHYVGKPYLKVLPRKIAGKLSDEKLHELVELFKELKTVWLKGKEEITRLLDTGHLSYYTTKSINKWIKLLEKWMASGVASIQCFDKFERFSQSYIDNSLKKASLRKGQRPPQHHFFQLVDDYLEVVHSLPDYEVIFKQTLFTYLAEKLDEKKQDLQIYSYDDLLIRLRNAFDYSEYGTRLAELLRRAYPVALVDEFQDTDPVQYQILKTIYTGGRKSALFIIGDPKQAIYSFRGADVFVYIQARKETPEKNRYSLAANFRSTPPLLDAMNSFFGSFPNPFLLDSISYQAVKAGRKKMECLQIDGAPYEPFVIRCLTSPDNQKTQNKDDVILRVAKDTSNQIKKILNDIQQGKATIGERVLQARDIAVLVRNHRQAELVKDELKKQKINCIIRSRSDVFKSEEARQLSIVMQAVADPADGCLAAALSTTLFGLTGDELYRLQEDETCRTQEIERFYRWHRLWQEQGFSGFFETMMKQAKVAEVIMERENGERMLTNLRHLSGLIREEEKKTGSGPHSLLKWLRTKRNEKKGNDVEEQQLRLESDENLVQVVTQHSSKGLEYSVVLCPFLWYSQQKKDKGGPLVYHDPDDNNRMVLDLNGKDDPNRSAKRFRQAKETLEEDLRLAYVALTRAEQKCIIHWVYVNDSVHSPLGYLLLDKATALEGLRKACTTGEKDEVDYMPEFERALDGLGHLPEINVQIVNENDEEPENITSSVSLARLKSQTFSRTAPLSAGRGLSSFSSLTQMNDDADFDTIDYYDELIARHNESVDSASGIFGFPKGPAPGTAVHHIFEHIDFKRSDRWNNLIRKYLDQEDIASQWQPVIFEMLKQTVNKPLLDLEPSLKLAAIEPDRMVSEMRFHFTNEPVELRDLLGIIRSEPPSRGLPEKYVAEGFLTGFIDLTFQFNNRYYILDYKTNHLGNIIEDYDGAGLEAEMKAHYYDLQYHLYLVALHRYLGQKLPDYQYKTHIGGALYLFVRGINKETDAGIFFDLPKMTRINELDNYFKRSGL